MPKASKGKKIQSNLDKMKNEMRRKKEKAERLFISGLHVESTVIPEEAEESIFDQEKSKVSNYVMADKVDLIVFQVGMEEFAFRLKHVKEIVRVTEIKKVPNAPAHVVGLTSLRGGVLPVVDIRRCFNMSQKEIDDDSRIIVTDIQGRQVGIITDRISQVTSVEVSSIVEPPANIKNMKGGHVSGIVVKDKGKSIIMVLDVEKIVDIRQLEPAFVESQVSGKDDFAALESHIGDKEELVIFKIGSENYALNIKNVKEILRYGEFLNVPNSQYYVEGVMSVRNNLLTVINLGMIFWAGQHLICESTRIIVVDADTFSYGIVVDKVSEVASVPRQFFYKPFRIVKNAEMEFVSQFANLNDGKKITMVLDPHKIASFISLSVIDSDMKEDTQESDSISEKSSKEQLHQEQMVVFKMDDEEYGIRIEYACEINNINEIVRIPGAPDFINGMVSLRGDIIPVMNLRTLFGISGISKSSLSKLLIVEHKNERVGIMIDSVSEVISMNRELLEATPQALESDYNKKYIHQVGKLNEGKRSILIVDLTVVLDFI